MSFPAEILTTNEQSILSTTQIRSSEGLDYLTKGVSTVADNKLPDVKPLEEVFLGPPRSV